MNGYEKRTEVKKQAVVNAARVLFVRQGYSNVSINDIAKLSGISHVSIYNYFGDKKALAVEALESMLDKAIEDYEQVLKQNILFKEKLKQIMELKNTKIEEVTRSYFSTLAWGDKAFQEVYREAAYKKAVPVYQRFIELGKAEGAIDSDIPNETILKYIFQVMPLLQHKDYLKTSAEYKLGLFKLFLYGILGKE